MAKEKPLQARIIVDYSSKPQEIDKRILNNMRLVAQVHLSGVADLFGIGFDRAFYGILEGIYEDPKLQTLTEVFHFYKNNITALERKHLENVLNRTSYHLSTQAMFAACMFQKFPYKVNFY